MSIDAAFANAAGGGSASGGDPFLQAFEGVLQSAPGLSGSDPALALDAAQSGDNRAAVVLAQGANLNAAQTAADQEESDGGGGKGFMHWVAGVGGHIADALNKIPGEEGVENAVGSVATPVMHALSKPVDSVHDDYAYLHKVWTDHGLVPGLLATLGVAGGAVAGWYVGQPELGADAAMELERRLAQAGVFGDSYQQTAKEAETAQISPGRDLAAGLGNIPGLHTLQNTDSGFGKYLSGGADLATMFKFDPIARALGAKADVHTGEAAMKVRSARAADWLAQNAPGFRATTPEALDSLYHSPVQGPAYQRGLADIAKSDSATIAVKYPQLESLAADEVVAKNGKVFQGLGSATSVDEVHNVFRNLLADAEFNKRLTNMATLPSKSLTRVPFSAAAEALRKVDGETPVSEQRNLLLPQKVGDGAKDWAAPAILHPTDLPGAVARKVRTFSGYMPYAIDKDTLALSTKKFSRDDPLANQGVYRTFRYSMGDTRARYWTNRFINAKSEEEAQRIWSEGQVEMYKAAGLPDDHFFVTNLRAKLHDASTPPMTEPKAVYGVGLQNGTDVSNVQLTDRTDSAALFGFQAGEYQFPNFTHLKREMRAAQGTVKNFAGGMDDFIADKFTNPWFKPLALLTAGFGLRVAAAEALPAAMRYGAMNMLRGQVVSQAAKRDWRLDQGEDGHLLAATSRLFGGMQGLVRATPEDRELALDLVHDSNGHIVTGVGRTGDESGHAYLLPDSSADKAKALTYITRSELKRQPRYEGHLDGNFDTISPDNPIYNEEWLTRLQQHSQDVPSQLVLKDLAGGMTQQQAAFAEAERIRKAALGEPDAHPAYAYEAQRLKRYGYVTDEGYDPMTFAEDRVDALHGLLTGADGKFHSPLADKLANGEKPTIEDVDAIDKLSRPKQVYGPLRMPYIGNGALQQLVGSGFKRFVDPIINNISREPIYFNAVKQEMRSLQHFVDDGSMDYETALRIAKTRGAVSMLPQIHNVALRSQFAVVAKNILPFYFAQEQALKRVGYLSAMHPDAIRQYELMHHALNEPGFIQGDSSTGKYLAFPAVGGFGKLAAMGLSGLGVPIESALPVSVSGNMSSLKTVLPEFQTPGVSPLVAVSLNTLSNLFPELRPAVKATVGPVAFDQGAIDALLPNTFLRNTFNALHPDEKSRSFGNAFLGSLAQAYYEGKFPGPDASPGEKAAFIDRIKNNTRSNFFVKALLGVVSPLAPQVQNENPEFRPEFLKLVKDQGYEQGLNTFLNEHGDKAISYTIARSQPSTPGANLPYTQQAMDWINNNPDLVEGDNATGAAFLVPQEQGSGDVGLIHDELLKMHLRERRTPETFRDALYVAMGNRRIASAKQAHDDYLKANAGNKQAVDAENKHWGDYVQQVGLDNPIWWDSYQSQDKNHVADRAYSDLLKIFQSPKGEQVLQTTQGQLVGGMVKEYQGHLYRLAKIGSSRTQVANAARKVENDGWSKFLDQTAQTDPRLTSVIQSVFSRLDATLNVGQ